MYSFPTGIVIPNVTNKKFNFFAVRTVSVRGCLICYGLVTLLVLAVSCFLVSPFTIKNNGSHGVYTGHMNIYISSNRPISDGSINVKIK